jgi:hypothetical protein
MNINRSENLNAQITVTDGEGNAKAVGSAHATVDTGNCAVSISMVVNDKAAAADSANTTAIRQQFDEFITSVRAAAGEAGLAMFAEGGAQ